MAALSAWVVAFASVAAVLGVPTDPAYAFLWLWLATIAWNSHLAWREHLRFVRDWWWLALLLTLYNLSRGFADNGVTPHASGMIDIDRAMWGWLTGDTLPTVWLQQNLYDPLRIHWYDVLVSFVYFSHFLVVPVAAAVLWVRDRRRWASLVRRWFTLTVLGLATYFLFPAAPPWWAAEHGLIEPVVRISTRGWSAIGMHSAGGVLGAAQIHAANPIAAMPSLHAGFAVLAMAFFLPVVRARWRPLLVAYPLAMTFTLVYAGEHYVVDVLVGAAYVAVTFAVVGLAERRWFAVQPSPTALSNRGERNEASDGERQSETEISSQHPQHIG